MEMTELISAIGSVGFPIVACCGLFYLYNETITKITTTLNLLNKSVEMLAEELQKNNTQVGGNLDVLKQTLGGEIKMS